jgi:hypothetical protein
MNNTYRAIKDKYSWHNHNFTLFRLTVFESRVLRRISGARAGEVTGGWRKLHNEQLLFTSPLFSLIN